MSRFDREVDATGLNCPLPILRTKKALATMESGQLIRVIATDPGSVQDFSAFCRQTAHELMESAQRDGFYYFVIRKSVA